MMQIARWGVTTADVRSLLRDACAVLATGVAALGLWSWIGGVEDLFTSAPGRVPMAPSTGVVFLVAGGTTWCRHRPWAGTATARIGRVLMGAVGGAGLLACVRTALGWDLPLDAWLARSAETIGDIPLGRMSSPLTGAMFVALAVSFLVQSSLRPAGRVARGIPIALTSAVLVVGLGLSAGYLTGRPWVFAGHRIPMAPWTAVAFTFLGLALVLAWADSPASRGAGDARAPSVARSAWVPLAISGLLAVAIALAGALYLRYGQATQTREEVSNSLRAIADLRAAQIARWRKERLDDARFLSRAPFVARDLRSLLSHPDSASVRADVRDWLELARDNDQYEAVALFDAGLAPRLVFPAGVPLSPSPASPSVVAAALRERRVLLSDFHRDGAGGRPHLGVAFPIFEPPSSRGATPPTAEPIGVGLLRIDPAGFLYPLIQTWPVPSASAETLLIRREGNEVVYLNKLRHRDNVPLNLRFGLGSRALPAAMAVQGRRGVMEGLDYRGVPVLAALRAVPDSPWFIVAKVDRAEVYAPIRRQAWLTLALTAVLVILAGTVAQVVWQRREAAFAREDRLAERRRFALSERIALLMQQANDAILLLDENWRILEANQRAIETYGYREDELRQMTLRDLRAPELRGAFDAQVREADLSRGSIQETVHQRKDGTRLHVEASLGAVVIEGRTYYQNMLRDITRRKEAEDALRESRHTLGVVVDTSPLAMIVTDRAAVVTLWNLAAARTFGWTTQDAVGRPDPTIPPDRAEEAAAMSAAVLGGEVFVGRETERVRKDGSPLAAGVSAAPLRDRDGTIAGILTVVADLTARKRLEEERARLEAQLRQQQKLEAIGTLAGGVAHEINNPVTGVMNYAQLIVDTSPPGARAIEYAAGIIRETERVATIVRNLLQFARVDKQSHSPARIEDIVDQTLSLVRAVLRRDQITLEVEVPAGLPRVKCRSQQIQQVLMNLMTNARDALNERYPGYDPAKVVRVQVTGPTEGRDGRHWVRITVVDRGNGIPADIGSRVFDPFFTTKPRDRGTGLGLSISHGIVQDHHGALHFETEAGQGTRFHVDLPVDNGWTLEDGGTEPRPPTV